MEIWSHADGHWQRGDLPGATVRWFDVCGAESGELESLQERFGLHELSIEDCLSRLVHAPKIDEFTDHLFIVLHALVPGSQGPETEELDVFLGRDFLITYQDERVPATEAVGRILAQGITVRPGADGLLYEISDRAVDAILPQVNDLGEELDRLQEVVVRGRLKEDPNAAILAIRAGAGQIRRLLLPQLTVVQRLSRGEFAAVAEGNRIYFRDIYDHLVRIDLALEGLREDAEVALSTYLAAINNRMGEVMKVLSIVGALALPAVVIAGIFGTNFDNVPGLHSNWGFATMIATMGGLGGGMAYYFYRRGWF
ncbi:MAG: magnesium transporter CorA family protein [Thermoflexaceae bacterium]|nr:magnesium transporter CorA family protein [Thermoflexaceae bacterium]